MSPLEIKVAAGIGVVLIAAAVFAAAWANDPNGLHNNDNLRPATSAQREHWRVQ